MLGRTAMAPGAKPTTFYSFSNSSICFSALQFVELLPSAFYFLAISAPVNAMYLFFLRLPFNCNIPKVNHLTCTLGKYPSQVIGSLLLYQILQAVLHKPALNLCSTISKIWTQEWPLHTEAVSYCAFLHHCTQLVSFAH